MQGHAGYVFTPRFSPGGERIVTASADGTARLWDGATGASQAVLSGHGKEVLSATFSPDGQLVATASAMASPASGKPRPARAWPC